MLYGEMKMNHTYLDKSLLKKKIDQNQLIEELKKSFKANKVTEELHLIIYHMCYKYCSKYIVRIGQMGFGYEEAVTDIYIYTIKQALKFNMNREVLQPFSYFTSVINNQFICITKKSMSLYNLRKQYMNEKADEQLIMKPRS